MKNGTLYKVRIDLYFSSVIGDRAYVYRDDMIIFIELVKKYDIKMLYFCTRINLLDMTFHSNLTKMNALELGLNDRRKSLQTSPSCWVLC